MVMGLQRSPNQRMLKFIFLTFICNEILKCSFTEQYSLKKSEFSEKKVLMSLNNTPCNINMCEILKYFLEEIMLLKGSIASDNKQMFGEEEKKHIFNLPFDLSLLKRVRQIENRLRSIEQPVWRLAPASQNEWNQCAAGICRCCPETKSFICWNTNFSFLPINQVIPMNMILMSKASAFAATQLGDGRCQMRSVLLNLYWKIGYFSDLSRNFFSTLHKDAFRGLTLLKVLDLSYNMLNFIPEHIFKDLDGLVQLRLQNNQIENLEKTTFWKLRNLNLIDVSKNMIAELPTDIFSHVQRLTVINLSYNKIKYFTTGLLREQSMLEELDLSRNEISELQSGSLFNLKSLKVLDFSYNLIAKIPDDLFADLKSLRTLILHNNRISLVSRTLFRNLTQLITLDLSTNWISEMGEHSFSGLSNLRELLLGQNHLSDLPDNMFININSLISLNLFSNNLTSIESNDFRGLTNLKNLMLNNNVLSKIEGDAFTSMKNLEKIRIDSNKLLYLENGALHDLRKLVAVKLDKNPWHCDCHVLYLARWIREFAYKLWDGQMAICQGPGSLGGHEVGLLRYDELCDGQWASMLSLSPRLPLRKHHISIPLNYTEYFNLYLKHIYSTTQRMEITGK
ncbi:leucine-rich repeat-containing protein 15-like [Eurosta solidaginis]|uniref:leucine-rich repeat-containing protein 15-like n=1 Tax=Eurosta solidaginis TaxID=178769 RepID=UPI0035313451